MLVRLTEEYRHKGRLGQEVVTRVGTIIQLPDAEAMRLIEQGAALPNTAPLAETRTKSMFADRRVH